MARDGSRRPNNIFLLGLVSFFTDLGTYMVYPLVPVYLTSIGATPLIIGVIEGVSESLTSLLKFVSGYWSDRVKKRKHLAVLGYGFSAVGRFLLALARSWQGVFLWRVADRLGKGIRTAPRDALICEASRDRKYGRSFGFHETMDMFGAAAGIGAAYLVVKGPGNSLTRVFVYSLIPVIIGFLILFLVKEQKQDQDQDQVQPVKKAALFRFGWQGLRPELKKVLLVIFLFTLANSSNQFLILRASEAGVSTAGVLLLYLVFHVVAASLSYPAGRLSDAWGRKNLLVAGYLLYGVVYLGFGAFGSMRWFFLLFGLYGVYSGLTKGVEKALVADISPKELKATMMGTYSMLTGIGLLPSSLITGWLWSSFGARSPFYLNGCLALIAALLLYLVLRGKLFGKPDY